MSRRGSRPQRRSWRGGFEEKQEGTWGRVAKVLGEDGQPEDEEHAGEGGEEGAGGEHLLYVAVRVLLVDRQVVFHLVQFIFMTPDLFFFFSY